MKHILLGTVYDILSKVFYVWLKFVLSLLQFEEGDVEDSPIISSEMVLGYLRTTNFIDLNNVTITAQRKQDAVNDVSSL